MTNLLYICRANINRSPAAEEITREKIRRYGITNLSVDSAGLVDPPYLGMTDEMRKALRILGYTPAHNSHKPVKVTEDLLYAQDVILCMKKRHIGSILDKFSGLEAKLYTLSEFAGFGGEVTDPHKLIGEIPAFSILKHTQYLREIAYRSFGKVDPRDERGVIRVHVDIAKEIERYVDKALERMAGEGRISKPPHG